jgi:DNA polymerase-3 subunit delta'
LPHALLFSGVAGIGKAHLVRAFAARLLCAEPRDGLACGGCKSCDLLAAGSHPDVLDVCPEEGSRVIKIDQVRDLIDFASRTPAIADRKLVLLGPAEAMNINAANALLKVLEEPSASTTLLLYSHQPSGLPATVRSRCQALVLPPPRTEVCMGWLAPMCGGEELAGELLRATGNRPLAALSLFQQDGLPARQAVGEGLAALLEGRLSPLAVPGLVSDLDLPDVLALMQTSLEGELRRGIRPGSREIREAFLLRDQLARLQGAIANGANPNRQLIIEDCATRMASAFRQGAS